MLMIDLDGFKQVNDTLGHQAGDEVLCEVSHRLRKVIRSADLVARLGGDEFAIIMETGATAQGAAVLAKKFGCAVDAPIFVGEQKVKVGASIGMAIYPDHAEEHVTLMHHADAAMYEAKKSGALFTIYGSNGSKQRPLDDTQQKVPQIAVT